MMTRGRNEKFALRLSSEEKMRLKQLSTSIGIAPADVIRMLIKREHDLRIGPVRFGSVPFSEFRENRQPVGATSTLPVEALHPVETDTGEATPT